MRLSGLRRALAIGVAATAAAATTVSAPGGAVAASPWAPAETATITPGVQMVTKGAQCTANFVFKDRRGRVYVGYSAHCAGRGEATDTNGCNTLSRPVGTRVRFERGGTVATSGTRIARGRLAYSSWLTMQRLGTSDFATCEFNDFALVRLPKAAVKKVNPSVPHWGGPTGLRTTGLSFGDEVYSYGNSSLRAGVTLTSPKVGTSTGDHQSGWSHNVYTATPGIPGDSGSGFIDEAGRAFGTLSTIAAAPFPAENGVGDLARELAFAKQHSGIPGLRLVKGTEPFVGLG
jgi:hypothetical protein